MKKIIDLRLIKNLSICALIVYAVLATNECYQVCKHSDRVTEYLIESRNANAELRDRVDYLTEECNHRDAILDDLGYQPVKFEQFKALEVK